MRLLLPEIITVNLTKETAWALGTEVESNTERRDNPTVRIKLGYDAIKDMNLKGNTKESDEKNLNHLKPLPTMSTFPGLPVTTYLSLTSVAPHPWVRTLDPNNKAAYQHNRTE